MRRVICLIVSLLLISSTIWAVDNKTGPTDTPTVTVLNSPADISKISEYPVFALNRAAAEKADQNAKDLSYLRSTVIPAKDNLIKQVTEDLDKAQRQRDLFKTAAVVTTVAFLVMTAISIIQ